MRQVYKLSSSKTTKSASNAFALNRSVSTYNVPTTLKTNGFWPAPKTSYGLQKSLSTTSVVEYEKCIKPSDRKDPAKRAFLASLTKKVFKVGAVS